MAFVGGDGAVFEAFGDDDQVALGKLDFGGAKTARCARVLLAELHCERAGVDEEGFVLVGVGVPIELALDLDEFDLLAVEVCRDARGPVVGEGGEGGGEVEEAGEHGRRVLASRRGVAVSSRLVALVWRGSHRDRRGGLGDTMLVPPAT